MIKFRAQDLGFSFRGSIPGCERQTHQGRFGPFGSVSISALKGLVAAALLSSVTTRANAQEDPFADAVETRHGLMLQKGSDLGKMGAMAKGNVAFGAPAGPRRRRMPRF